MSLNNRHATILLLLISTILLIIIDIIVVFKFFTYDELIENTYIKASINTTSSSSIDKRAFKEENYIIHEDIYEDNYIEPIEEDIQDNFIEPIEEKDIENNYINEESIEDKTVLYDSSIGTITIPKTNVDLPIFDSITNSNMNTGTCFLYSTGSLNKSGTTIIVGHNYQNGKLFSNNDNLQIGDVIYITLLDGSSYCYTVYDKIYTTPEDLSYLDKNTSNQPEIALSSCTDNEEGRIIILAR